MVGNLSAPAASANFVSAGDAPARWNLGHTTESEAVVAEIDRFDAATTPFSEGMIVSASGKDPPVRLVSSTPEGRGPKYPSGFKVERWRRLPPEHKNEHAP
jgi:hypothetical protein